LVKYDASTKGGLDLITGVGSAVAGYAVNGAVHYAIHIAEKTNSFKEVIAVGVVGDSESNMIQPYYVSCENEEIEIRKLSALRSLQDLNPRKISDWYKEQVLGTKLTKEKKEVLELQSIASELHEDLRNYGSLEGENKATVISAVLLALINQEFHPDQLIASKTPKNTDGDKIVRAAEGFISVEDVLSQDKVKILLNKFAFLRTNVVLNTKNDTLNMTPLKYFAIQLNHRVLPHLLHRENSGIEFDILGNFYGEFVKYGGSDGNSLGIVLTPSHITSLMTKLIEIKPTQTILDPSCGTGSFLISAMNKMIETVKNDQHLTDNEKQNFIKDIKRNQLLGIEMQEKMFTIATTNMILRGDGKSRLQLADMFAVTACPEMEYHALDEKSKEGSIPKVDRILFNPPYSQGKKDKSLTEISFIFHALSFLKNEGKMAVIVPQSTMVGKSKEEKLLKRKILENHVLESVITLNKDTFYGVGVNPCIAIFKAGEPHPENKKVKFVNFEDDGFVVRKHVGLIDDGTSVEKRRYLVDVLQGNVDDCSTEFMVKSTITAEDEWLHSYFYFNDSPPIESDFEKTIADYLTFQFDM
jgi:type I restriction-modification system DNA methylase subunit